MPEIDDSGYEDFRRVVNSSLTAPDQWDYISVRDDAGSEIFRVSITGDSRAQWNTSDASSDTQECEITVSGDDSEISLPETISGSALYEVDSGGTARSVDDSMADATMEAAADEVIITHTIEGPVNI